jgi:hypothetical protein
MSGFEWGLGPIGWIYPAEIVPPKGVAISTCVNWTFTFLAGALPKILLVEIQGEEKLTHLIGISYLIYTGVMLSVKYKGYKNVRPFL